MSVSVVIPSYNHAHYVEQAIRSVLDQTCMDVELIVIDDGSTDGSVEIIEALHEQQGETFTFIARENRGLVYTLQQGLELARGTFFCELASDDFFPSDSIALRLEEFSRHEDLVAVYGDGWLVDGTNSTGETILDSRRKNIFRAEDQIEHMLAEKFPIFSTGLFRRDALIRCGGFDHRLLRFYEDLDTTLRLANVGRFGFVDSPVINRRRHETNVSTTTSHIRLEKVLCFEKLANARDFKPYRCHVNRLLRRSLLALGRDLVRRKESSPQERKALSLGWKFVCRDPRLLYFLLRVN